MGNVVVPASIKTVYNDGVRRAFLPVAAWLVNGRITPNKLTAIGLALNCVTAVLIVTQHFVWAAIVMLLAGTCDMLDGSVARLSAQVTPFGAFIDSTSDRLAEGIVLGAVGAYLATDGQFWMLGVVFVVLIASYLVSYTRARAEALGLDCKVGLMSRPERIVVLAVGLLFAPHFYVLQGALLLMAAATSITVVVRILHVRRQILNAATD